MKNHISDSAWYGDPATWYQMMNRNDLHDTLMYTGGCIFRYGEVWHIKSENLGAGAYKVYLEKKAHGLSTR